MLQSDIEAQQNVAPFLRHKVLRNIVKSFTTSPGDDFETWAKNQQVIDTLTEAQRLLNNGCITEQQLEDSFLAYAQVCTSKQLLIGKAACYDCTPVSCQA